MGKSKIHNSHASTSSPSLHGWPARHGSYATHELHAPTRPALDAGSAEVLGNIKALLK